MNYYLRYALWLLLLPTSLYADQSFYCPQKSKTISVGMTMDQVIAACGAPLSKQDSNEPVTVKIPVQTLIFNNLGTDTAFYDQWNIPTGSGGAQVEVNVVNNKVKDIKVNSSNSNALSMCEGANIQAGDDVSKVYYNCGSPAIVNNTFINQIVDTKDPPQVWIYQSSQYVPPVSLTFVNGKLQSIR